MGPRTGPCTRCLETVAHMFSTGEWLAGKLLGEIPSGDITTESSLVVDDLHLSNMVVFHSHVRLAQSNP